VLRLKKKMRGLIYRWRSKLMIMLKRHDTPDSYVTTLTHAPEDQIIYTPGNRKQVSYYKIVICLPSVDTKVLSREILSMDYLAERWKRFGL
jgi:hypothetical protein